jgi:2-furoyl-CoA dehydrogenase 2Fe-2S iron sulfur subunit
MLLSDYLRHELGLTGTHVGCEHGVCGACTVRLDGVACRSCLTLAVQADGRRVDTVEGLAGEDGVLSELQAAFKRHHALQCGFCTAGILMSSADWLERLRAQGRRPTEQEVREMLSGHLCRCTG